MKKEEKISFLKRMIISIKDFEKYQDFALENVKVGIKYLLKLMLIFIAVISVTLSYKSSITINNGNISNVDFEISETDMLALDQLSI